MFRRLQIAALTCLISLSVTAQKIHEPISDNKDWTNPYQPFRVAGNVYYVGTYDLACYLITGSKGHILINTGVASSATQIQSSIESLGFKMKDVKILLTNQVHFDHVGAIAALKKLTGAKLMIDSKDAPVMEDGGKTDYYFGGNTPSFAPAKPDRTLQDKDSIVLGENKLTMLHHPGHTRGSCSYMINVKDGNKTIRLLIANIPSIIIDEDKKFSDVKSYPSMANDYAYTLAAMEKLDFDIWVAAHASQFGLHDKRKEGDPYNTSIFADKEKLFKRIQKIKKEFEEKKAAE
ncbi:MAG: subclass B3 metallo-beta-lactamase [Chitinophagaceae bacterium]|nr:subclass B3 metallo-beta-lactamase [Chitinophagaceae bacterium]